MNKNFPESEETQKGHMRNQKQGVRPIRIRQAIQSSENKVCNMEIEKSTAQIPNGYKD